MLDEFQFRVSVRFRVGQSDEMNRCEFRELQSRDSVYMSFNEHWMLGLYDDIEVLREL